MSGKYFTWRKKPLINKRYFELWIKRQNLFIYAISLYFFLLLLFSFLHLFSHTFIRLGKQDENENSPYNQNENPRVN